MGKKERRKEGRKKERKETTNQPTKLSPLTSNVEVTSETSTSKGSLPSPMRSWDRAAAADGAGLKPLEGAKAKPSAPRMAREAHATAAETFITLRVIDCERQWLLSSSMECPTTVREITKNSEALRARYVCDF